METNNMKLIKLTDEHYIIVNDSEIIGGDYVIKKNTIIKTEIGEEVNEWIWDGYKKITHSTLPFEDIVTENSFKTYDFISLEEIEGLIGEVDVEKKAEEYKNIKGRIPTTELEDEIFKLGYKDGYKQCLKDMKEKKYTENDLRLAYREGFKQRGNPEPNNAEKFFKSLEKTEWEIEMIKNKIKLK